MTFTAPLRVTPDKSAVPEVNLSIVVLGNVNEICEPNPTLPEVSMALELAIEIVLFPTRLASAATVMS